MPVLHAIVLGIVQGLTEFLPISSSGHLQLVPWLFGWDDFGGDKSLETAFDVALHMGTLVGALAYFRRDVAGLTVGGIDWLRGRRTEQGRQAWLLVLSAVPAAIVGVGLQSQIESNDDRIWLTAVMLIVFGLVLFAADRVLGRRTIEQFSVRDALAMGVGQAVALQPGVSRSGVTITVARAIGFEREAATRIAFLMSLPVIAGAGLYQFIDIGGPGGIPADLRAGFIWGMVTSAVAGWVAVWGTLKLVRTSSFTPFVVYRVLAGIAVLSILATSFR
ncbi:MAG: undecaprenyl-diphosphate phosphatase [Acidimicrobiales bacterium]